MITSTSNAQVKNIMNLIKKSGERKNRGLFVIEGIRMFVEIPKDRIVKIYASESFAYDNKEMLCDYDFEMVSDVVYKQMSDTKTPQGIMAIVKMLEYNLSDILAKDKNPLFVILENIQDPGNLGTIIRTAEGAGVTGIIMSKDTVDIYNPKVIRSTMGSLFRVPFVYEENIQETVKDLQKKNIKIFAAHLMGQNQYYNENMTEPMGILIGNEGNGLSEELSSMANVKIRIPMEGQLESLNAAVSTAIIVYEAYRQRNN